VNDEDLRVYNSWLDIPPAPAQASRFYHLKPIGWGTSLIEGLTGNIIRHAEEFGVPVQILFREELGPLLGRKQLERANASAAFMRTAGHTFNGRDTLAQDMVEIMAQLTGGCDLRFSTMLPWADVLSYSELVRKVRTWCSVCWHEWREAGEVVYEPLLWSVSAISICPIHRRHLQTRCSYPDCGKQSPILAPYARPGHCPSCRRWLGQPLNVIPLETIPAQQEMPLHAWIVDVVGELLAAAPSLEEWPRRQQIGNIISTYYAAAGSLYRLQHTTGIHATVLQRWRDGLMIPPLRQLLRFCHVFSLTPKEFLTTNPQTFTPRLLDVRTKPWPVTAKRKRTSLDTEKIRQTLEHILASDDDYPSVFEVAKRLGVGRTTLEPHFPDLIAALAARHLAHRKAKKAVRLQACVDEIRRAATDLHHRAIYPSAVHVQAEVRLSMHFAEPEIYEAWRAILNELGWSLNGQKLSEKDGS